MLEEIYQKPINNFNVRNIIPEYNADHILAKDPLVSLKDYHISGQNYYARTDKLNYPYCKTISSFQELLSRKTVAEKLVRINEKANKYGLELFVFDAFRPIDTQIKLWNHFVSEAQKTAKNYQEAEEIAQTYCFPPNNFDKSNPLTHPVHSTGGAVDLTLRFIKTKEQLFMGSIFDEDSAVSAAMWFEHKQGTSDLSKSDIAALYNRRILHHFMIEEDFAANPNEWWHFDYGTSLWAKSSLNQSENNLFFYQTALF
ncbi:MAG: M15 family metallopeptidase [Alphaproteobacteria bacterium]